MMQIEAVVVAFGEAKIIPIKRERGGTISLKLSSLSLLYPFPKRVGTRSMELKASSPLRPWALRVVRRKEPPPNGTN